MELVRCKATAKMIDYNNIHSFNFFSHTFHTLGNVFVKKISSEAFIFYFGTMRGALPRCNF